MCSFDTRTFQNPEVVHCTSLNKVFFATFNFADTIAMMLGHVLKLAELYCDCVDLPHLAADASSLSESDVKTDLDHGA